MVDLVALKAANEKRWSLAKVTRNFSGIAKSLVAAKARYQAVEAKTGVPWFVIAVIHERESSQNWSRSLAQGDPWNKVSVHVPAGRGPFSSWEAAAIDALVNCHPFLASNKDWSIGGVLLALEKYNGIGYAQKGVPSPYLWAGTNQYKSGKYIADHVYDADKVDTQPGTANLLMAMMVADPTITFTGAVIKPINEPAPKKPASTTKKAAGSVATGAGVGETARQAGVPVEWAIAIGVATAIAVFLFWKLKGK